MSRPESAATGRPTRTTLLALGLFVACLVLLVVGGFVQFDDTSGFGSDRWVRPLGFLAAGVAVVSVLVALPERSARRPLGMALLGLDALLIVQGVADDGFRFIWTADEAELFYLQVGLGLLGLALVTPRVWVHEQTDAASQRTLTGWVRFVLYAATAVVAVIAAFFLGVERFDRAHCSAPDFDGECDLALLEGLLWAVGAFALVLLSAVVLEVSRRRARSHELRSTDRARE